MRSALRLRSHITLPIRQHPCLSQGRMRDGRQAGGSRWTPRPVPNGHAALVVLYCGAQDTFYVGHLKGVGRVYQQTFIDTYAKVACAKLYDRKTPITAADLLNDRVIPLFDGHDVKLLRLLTDRGRCRFDTGVRPWRGSGRESRASAHQDTS